MLASGPTRRQWGECPIRAERSILARVTAACRASPNSGPSSAIEPSSRSGSTLPSRSLEGSGESAGRRVEVGGPPAGARGPDDVGRPVVADVEDRVRRRVAERLPRRGEDLRVGLDRADPLADDDRPEVRRPARRLDEAVDRGGERPVREDRRARAGPRQALQERARPRGPAAAGRRTPRCRRRRAQSISSGVESARPPTPRPSGRRPAAAAMPRSRARTRTTRWARSTSRNCGHLLAELALALLRPDAARNASRSNGPSARRPLGRRARRRARSAGPSTGTSVFPKSNVIAAMPAGLEPAHVATLDGQIVPERAVAAGHPIRLRREVAGPDPGRRGRDLLAGLRQPLADRPRPGPTSPESRKWSWTASGSRPVMRLVAHRVDLELERVAGPLAGLRRVADVARLVVGDRDPLAAGQLERRRDGVGVRRGGASGGRAPAPARRRPARCRPGPSGRGSGRRRG